MGKLSRDMKARIGKNGMWPRYNLCSDVSSGGHIWESRGLVRVWLNFIDQTPAWLLMLWAALTYFGVSALVRVLCR